MSVVLGGNNISSLRSEELIEMRENLDARYAIIPFIEKKKVLTLLLRGKKYMYLAVFNLEREAVKLYIRSLSSMDCCLFKKALDCQILNTAKV